MNNTTDFITAFSYYNMGAGFGLNTNILETNVINLAVVIGSLVYFGKGVCAN